jgi:hypothetical protein
MPFWFVLQPVDGTLADQVNLVEVRCEGSAKFVCTEKMLVDR